MIDDVEMDSAVNPTPKLVPEAEKTVEKENGDGDSDAMKADFATMATGVAAVPNGVKSPPQQWACIACSTLNKNLVNICSVCQKRRADNDFYDGPPVIEAEEFEDPDVSPFGKSLEHSNAPFTPSVGKF